MRKIKKRATTVRKKTMIKCRRRIKMQKMSKLMLKWKRVNLRNMTTIKRKKEIRISCKRQMMMIKSKKIKRKKRMLIRLQL